MTKSFGSSPSEKLNFIWLSDSTYPSSFEIPKYLLSLSTMWLIECANLSMLSSLYLPVDSQLFVFNEDEGDNIEIHEVYNIDVDKKQSVKKFGSWSREGLLIDPRPIFERRKDMEGLLLYGETMVEPPFINGNITDILSGRQRILGGYMGETWYEVEQIMNLTTKIVPGTGWGSLNADGTWNGIIDSLHQNRTQLGLYRI